MGTIREITKKNGTVSYHAEVRLRGFTKQRSTHRTRTLAKEWIQSLEAEMRDGRYKKRSKIQKHTVQELIDRYIEDKLSVYPKRLKKTETHFVWWKKQLGHVFLSDLTSTHIAECRDKLLREQTCRKALRNPATVNRYLASFSKALSVAVKEWDWIDENLMQKVEKKQESCGRERFLAPDEKKRLLEACRLSRHPCLYPIVTIALITAMRQGEILNLCWKDINFETKQIILQQTKNGDRRVIPLTQQLEQIFKSLLINTSPMQLVFRITNIRHAFAKALKQAGIEKFVFHDLRHTAASYLAMDGATQGELMAILGHRSPQMTRRYAHYSQQHLENLLKKSGEKLFQEASHAQKTDITI